MEMQLNEVFTSTISFLTQTSSKLGDFDQYSNYKNMCHAVAYRSRTENVILLLNSNSLYNKIIYKLKQMSR